MSVEYKQTAVVKKIYEALDNYLNAMKAMNKTPSTLWVTRKDYQRLLVDENKKLKADRPELAPVDKVPPFNGILVGKYR